MPQGGGGIPRRWAAPRRAPAPLGEHWSAGHHVPPAAELRKRREDRRTPQSGQLTVTRCGPLQSWGGSAPSSSAALQSAPDSKVQDYLESRVAWQPLHLCRTDEEAARSLHARYVPARVSQSGDYHQEKRAVLQLQNDIRLLLEQGCELGSASFCVAIIAAARRRRAGLAEHFFAHMCSLGIVPDHPCWSALLAAHAAAGSADKALEVQQRMRNQGMEPVGRDVVTIISALARARRSAEALKLFDESADWGVQSDPAAWNAALGACESFPQAQGLLKRMAAAGIAPTLPTFLVLLRVCGRTGDKAGIATVLAVMRKHGVAEDLAVDTALLNAMRRSGDLPGAQEVWDRISSPDSVAAAVFLGALGDELRRRGGARGEGAADLLQRAEGVFELTRPTAEAGMGGSNPRAWAAMMGVYAAHRGCQDRAERLLQAFASRCIRPTNELLGYYTAATGRHAPPPSDRFWRPGTPKPGGGPVLPPSWDNLPDPEQRQGGF
eukprot:TRINITY_DN26695_c0_g1_i4.p2 TRINITY_DN26695_c0_g1~~TRINITY_DN26695_c0_g1_i4.p2  ORF type:complete len:520 (+),score=160.44 TRINITY_DN26695_c0_g1_i4:81-1562(+)